MSVHYASVVRPGDKWDGCALVVTKTGFDWAGTEVTVVLRQGQGGPLVQTIIPEKSFGDGTLIVGFHLTAGQTAKLRRGETYYGSVVVQVPGVTPEDEPEFGPYTIFTWSLEVSDQSQPASPTYTVAFGAATTFEINLHEGSTIVITGGTGGTSMNGWSPILSVVNDSARRVLQIVDWTGGDGTKPATGSYISDTGLVSLIGSAQDIRGPAGANGADGAAGAAGTAGWSPILAVVNDGTRRVLQVTDWTGGAGTKPATGSYVGPTGLVALVANAVDIRGASGAGDTAVSVSYAASITPDLTAGNIFNVGTLTGNITINAPTGTPTDGARIQFRLNQDGTGGRTVTWNAIFRFGIDLTSADISTSASAENLITFRYNTAATKWEAIGLTRF